MSDDEDDASPNELFGETDEAARIAELEAERDAMTRRAIDDGAHDAIDASARMDEREATLALLDGMPDALASDIAATIRAMDEEPLPNRIAELEAERDKAREELAALMMRHSFATGHGDTISDLLGELDWQLTERRNRIIDTPPTQTDRRSVDNPPESET